MTNISRWIGSAVIVTALSSFYLYDQRSPLDFVAGVVSAAAPDHGQPAPNFITKGSVIIPAITLTWYRVDCSFAVTRMIRDGAGRDHKLPTDRPSVPPPASDIGKPLTSLRKIVVPNDALPGPNAHYRATLTFNCGYLGSFHSIVVEMPPMTFAISPPP